jgi:phosphatidate cytidylyltransferase
MSPSRALRDGIFLTYAILVVGLLLFAAAALTIAQFAFGKNVRSIWRTYGGWLWMIPMIAAAILLGRWAVILGTTLLAIFGFKEFSRATGLYQDWWTTGAVYLLMLLMAALTWSQQLQGFMILPVLAICLLAIIPVLRNRAEGQLQIIALSIFGFLYFGWMFGHLAWLANTANPYGYLIYLIFATELNDVVAFTSGKLFGHYPLRSHVSPKKTWGGAIGAIVVSMLLPLALRFSLPAFTTPQLLLIGLLVGIGGQLGDLVISVVKRDIGIKDMGATIPGHGGILDRIDSLIFVAPLFFHLVSYWKKIQ